jgi:integrase
MYNEMKIKFKDERISENNSYISMYEGLFDAVSPFEQTLHKDLCQFTTDDLQEFYRGIAPNYRYNTVVTFNSLVRDYKNWSISKGANGANGEVCTIDHLKSISGFKQYIILDDEDVRNMTEFLPIDGADYNQVGIIKLLWEIDGQEDVNDILQLKLQDINADKQTVTIYRSCFGKDENGKKSLAMKIPTTYNISGWLIDFLLDFADMDKLAFENRGANQGTYNIKKAVENNGYIFRTAYTKRTKVGEPIDGVKFSTLLYKFCERHFVETLTINDFLMSLALRYMLVQKKTHAQMYTQKRYFKNMPSSVYAETFNKFAKEKYEDLYNEYLIYFNVFEK